MNKAEVTTIHLCGVQGMKRIFDQYGDGRSYESLHALLFGVRADLHNTGVGRRLRALCFEEAAKLGVPIRFACGDDSVC